MSLKLKTNDDCFKTYEDLKFKKIDARYIIYKVEKKEVEVITIESIGKRSQTWDDFLTALPDKEYRFAVFDLEFTNADNMNISKLFFINWSPDETPLKARMIYATSKQGFREFLGAVGKQICLSSKKDMTLPELIKEFAK